MDLPFRLRLFTGGKKSNPVEELIFSKDKDFLNEYEAPKIKEFSELSIRFSSDDERCRLYIPELDDYFIDSHQEDENGNIFYKPSEKEIFIYNYEEEHTIPLIPGYYFLFVKSFDEIFYSQFEIIPKDLIHSDWVKMRSEVEESVSGLAVDFISKKRAQSNDIKSDISRKNYLFRRIKILEKEIPQAIVSLESLKKESKYKIVKHYSWNDPGRKNLVDQKTISQLQLHPEKRGLLYSHNRVITHDIIENQWIKFMLEHFKRFSLLANEYFEQLIHSITENKNDYDYYSYNKSESEKQYNDISYKKSVEEIKKSQKKMKHFYSYILEFLYSPMMKNVSSNRPLYVPKSLVLNTRYNSIYKMYLDNIRSITEIDLESEYEYYWKRTDTLYEIWCFIRVVKALMSKGFVPISGWLFDETNIMQELPFLHDETRVAFVKDDLKLNLVFNEPMKKESIKNTLVSPVKTSSTRNKPDIRLDIIVDGNKFIGSLILEVKYKKLVNIVQRDSGRQRQQLLSYKQNTMSDILSFPEAMARSLQAVVAVISLYPSDENGNKAPSYFENGGIYFHLLNPSSNEEALSSLTERFINERLNLYNDFCSTK